MIEREIAPRLIHLFRQYPFVTVTGPRQSGKTTLCKSVFPHLEYLSLEDPDMREFAQSDPRRFLSRLGEGAILDEIQHVPDLLSYLQVIADERGQNGLFVLTGSEQFGLSDTIGQSLAGRTALLRLLPLSIEERRKMGAGDEVDDFLYSGFYPRIFHQGLDPRQALADYFETYVERDVRRLGGVRSLDRFRLFVRLCAGRVGQLINFNSLASDVGVSHTTVRDWLTVLERSYIAFLMPPHYANIRRRLIKSPKLYFYDVGLASYLVGLERVEQMATYYRRGSLFENAVVVEALKHRFNRGYQSNLSFFRDSRGLECDLFYQTGRGIGAFEIKSGSTVSSGYFKDLKRVAELVPEILLKAVVYGGSSRQSRSDCEVLPLADLSGTLERFEVQQELAALVRDKRTEPDKSDVKILDAVYYGHIRPLLTALESSCRPVTEELFRGARDSFTFTWRNSPLSVDGWFQTGNWGEVKKSLIEKGFELNGSSRREFLFDYEFKSYTGKATEKFTDLLIRTVWELHGQDFTRRVFVGGERLPELDLEVRYAEVDTRSPEVDRAIANIGLSLVTQINLRSGG